MRKTKEKSRGFTLIELLVASTILVLIGTAVLTTFASGLHVYGRVQSYGSVQAQILLALEQMEKDIANTFRLADLPFVGGPTSLAFPAVIATVEKGENGDIFGATVGQVAYALGIDDDQKVLMRDAWDYGRALSKEGIEDGESGFVAFVKDLRFRYYTFDGDSGEYKWRNEWPEEEGRPPLAVNVELTFEDRGRDRVLARTVFIRSVNIATAQEEEEDGEDDEGEGGDGGELPEEI